MPSVISTTQKSLPCTVTTGTYMHTCYHSLMWLYQISPLVQLIVHACSMSLVRHFSKIMWMRLACKHSFDTCTNTYIWQNKVRQHRNKRNIMCAITMSSNKTVLSIGKEAFETVKHYSRATGVMSHRSASLGRSLLLFTTGKDGVLKYMQDFNAQAASCLHMSLSMLQQGMRGLPKGKKLMSHAKHAKTRYHERRAQIFATHT